MDPVYAQRVEYPDLSAIPTPAGAYVARTQQLTAAAVKDVSE